MKITISKALKQADQNLSLGVVEATIVVEKHSSGLWKEIDKQIASTGKSYSIESIAQLPEIIAVRETYKHIIIVIISFTGNGLKQGTERAVELLKKYAHAENCNVTIVS